MRALKAQVHTAIDDPTVTIIETRREATIREAGATVQRAYWLPSTTVFAPKGAYQALIPEDELDRYLKQIGVDESAHVAMALYLHGYDNVAMYAGSWTEWHQDERNPRDDMATMEARSPR